MIGLLIDMTERGLLPNPLVRIGIRKLCSDRLRALSAASQSRSSAIEEHVNMLRRSPVAVSTDAANEQHYEVPAEFYLQVLGPNLKYSCAYWEKDCTSLSQAESAAIEITIERAELRDGMKILELGCGWGSLSLAMAKKFPNAMITAVSNSSSQRQFIEAQAKAREIKNLEILTRDVSVLEDLGEGRGPFDRVVSVEMFEHLRNYETVMERVARWLAPDGKLFIHIFTHQQYPYLFDADGADNWMGKYFFTGGQMPSRKLLAEFQKDLRLEREWEWNGTHYQMTSEAWLKNLYARKPEILAIFEKTYGKSEAERWFHRWKIFFLAVSELFGYARGREWGVSHYLFARTGDTK